MGFGVGCTHSAGTGHLAAYPSPPNTAIMGLLSAEPQPCFLCVPESSPQGHLLLRHGSVQSHHSAQVVETALPPTPRHPSHLVACMPNRPFHLAPGPGRANGCVQKMLFKMHYVRAFKPRSRAVNFKDTGHDGRPSPGWWPAREPGPCLLLGTSRTRDSCAPL